MQNKATIKDTQKSHDVKFRWQRKIIRNRKKKIFFHLLNGCPPSKSVSLDFQSSLTLCNPMDYSMPGFLVHHQLLQLAQTHVHQVSDAILSSIFPSIRVFSNESVAKVSGGQSIGASASASVLPMNIQDWFPLGWTGWISLQPRDSQESSPTPQFKSINSSVLSFLYGPALTSIHDYWKSHSFH